MLFGSREWKMNNGSDTAKKMADFLVALSECGNVSRACEISGMSRLTAYRYRKARPKFADEWEKAKKIGAEALEDEAIRRAHEGVDDPVFHRGEPCGVVRRYSDTLLIFLLKGAMPEKYRDNSRLEMTGADGGPVEISDADRAARLAGLLALAQQRMSKANATDSESPPL